MSNTLTHRESATTHSPSALEFLPLPVIDDQPERQVVLSTAQQQALEWLTSGGSILEAAEFAGVCRQTVSRWLHTDPDFQTVYIEWREQAAAIVRGRLIAAGEAAMDNVMHAIRVKGDLRASEFVLKSLIAKRGK